jgi:hypothetical protein
MLRQKEEELWKLLKYFTMQKNIIFKKESPLKETKILQDIIIITFIITIYLKFQHKPKYHLSKNPQTKIDLLLLLLPIRGHNPLSYYYTL